MCCGFHLFSIFVAEGTFFAVPPISGAEMSNSFVEFLSAHGCRENYRIPLGHNKLNGLRGDSVMSLFPSSEGLHTS